MTRWSGDIRSIWNCQIHLEYNQNRLHSNLDFHWRARARDHLEIDWLDCIVVDRWIKWSSKSAELRISCVFFGCTTSGDEDYGKSIRMEWVYSWNSVQSNHWCVSQCNNGSHWSVGVAEGSEERCRPSRCSHRYHRLQKKYWIEMLSWLIRLWPDFRWE